jgi:hypothetical protein
LLTEILEQRSPVLKMTSDLVVGVNSGWQLMLVSQGSNLLESHRSINGQTVAVVVR